MIRAQDGDPDAALPEPRETHTVTAGSSGILTRLDALPFGIAAWRLGAGRARAQDGDPDAALPQPNETHTVTATEAGYVTRMEALPFGIAAWRLGAGRARAEDPVLHAAGIDLHVKPGDAVAAGQPVFTLLGHDATRFDRALEALGGSWEIGAEPPASVPLVLERITA
ncbi:MAG: hypothetical protein ABWY55_03250, partial [Microbacterium sp.]